MKAVKTELIGRICDGVWRDRVAILDGRGRHSGEEALIGAAYWRICKAGGTPGESIADCAPFLRELVRRYRAETGPAGGSPA